MSSRFFNALATCALLSPALLHGGILVDLDATSLPIGNLPTWQNQGTLGGDFTAEVFVPGVSEFFGVRGVTLDGNNTWYVGPTAPPSVTGNGSRTVFAWVLNSSIAAEETVFAWGRRGGADGTNASFNHGSNATYGAVGHWGSPDLGWSGTQVAEAWTCIAYTYDSATGIASVYTNGVVATSKNVTSLNTHATDTLGNALPFVVGCQNANNGARNNSQFPGSLTIAKIQVHDTALTAEEIAATFNTDATTFGLTPLAPPLTIHSFSAASESIYLGGSTDLSWSVTGHDTLSITPAVTVPDGASTVTVSPTATTTYTLTAANAGTTQTRTVTVQVDPGLPVAQPLQVSTSVNTALPLTLTATDPNPPAAGLLWTIVAAPQNGALSGTPPALTYTPASGFIGIDTFTFKVNDGDNDSNTATVTVEVHPPPVAPTGITALDTVIQRSATAGSFITNLAATDQSFNETHTYQLVTGEGSTHNSLFTLHGHQLLAAAGFTPDPGITYSVRLRVTDSTGLSYEAPITLTVGPAPHPVVINELFYDPRQNARTEFIELHNTSDAAISIAGWRFTSGVNFTFPAGATIPAGGYAVATMDPAAFVAEFGFAAHGPWSGRLSGDGETVELTDASGNVVDTVSYRSEFPWPISPKSEHGSMELIHPSLDNDIGGSWRGSEAPDSHSQLSYLTPASTGWLYKPGTSLPPNNWRTTGFTPDGTWIGAQSPIGFGTIDNLPLNTTISGMQGNYLSFFARKTFTVAPGEIPDLLLLRYSIDDGIIIWINGVEIVRRNVAGTLSDPPVTTSASSLGTEGLWYDFEIPFPAALLTTGTNVIAVRVFNQNLGSSDVGFDVELLRPASNTHRPPTPAAQNSVFALNAPPQTRQVRHSPQQPTSTETTTITAKVTDPHGVASVQLHYQIVEPGNYIPARFPRPVSQILANPKGERPLNPAFENPANWTTVPMTDDGSGSDLVAADSTFTVTLPARPHRTLVRYRITVTDLTGASVRLPYADDESLNFAYFVYDGVPDYVASTASVHPSGPGKVWPKELLTSLPVYHWIIRNQDMMALQAYNSSEQMPNSGSDTVLAARRTEEWEGAFVYDGIVYDHVHTRLRGGNSRYGDNENRFTRGKRHYKFQFNSGHHFQAKDERGIAYPSKWKSLAFNKMFGNKGGNGWGMPEEIGARLWTTFGVPAASTHWFHFRVIDGAAEAPDQYNGDFWGIQQVVEEYESTFLDARGIEKGNLYKMSDWIWDAERQRRYQSPDMVRDGSEFNAIRDHLHGGQNQAWLLDRVDYDAWYRYSAVAEAIRHYDLFPYTDNLRHSLKNLAWHFSPTGSDPTRGVVTFLPYDWDASFGPNWNNGWEHANNALYGWDMSTSDGLPYIDKPQMKLEHRNVLREFRDLVWQPDQINGLMDHRAAVISEISKADQDRWRNAPQSAGTANDDTLEFKLQDMKNFAFVGWTARGGTSIGPTVGSGGRAVYLDQLADSPDSGLLPTRPTITYTGEAGHPINGLSFSTGTFSDPQGSHTFGAMAWRIGEIQDPSAPAYDPSRDYVLEYDHVWDTGELTTYQNSITIPSSALKPGLTYRARIKMKDNTGRWSRWSAPYQFTAEAPAGLDDLQNFLVITEIMYNPAGPPYPGSNAQEYEFLELMNISDTVTLDLSDVRFHRGIDYNFSDGDITLLAPRQRIVIVKNRAAFESRYGTGLPIAGVWKAGDNLSNGGERLTLSFGADVAIHDFEYDDSDPWPTEPDGNGPSLVLINPDSAPDHGIAANWAVGTVPDGSPGFIDGPFATWLRTMGTNLPDAPYSDSLTHAMAYALGADLASRPEAVLPAASLSQGADGKDHLTLTYLRRIGATDASYAVEISTDLEGWQNGDTTVTPVGTPVAHGDGTETVTLRANLPVTSDPSRFIRLRIAVIR